ncbi:MAG: Preprotein translocase, SecG subunit [Candidatus Magasanikbacteria bacterium GW2011_GWC2_40_17]|uniref:Protein-export membrane protein SecG n=1 Tax=Candidatus Magasanikbacteria bacterium GW2011_GWA2_42_32 TaxID=1619039 RepID=A0A0G1D5G8_9BACT|nr:MAG: Preprotein translocase, SecG subunit [Candidatus Magasanikbacteria bacterium GW2011_GWC2_40_17]KKS57283.1 MAG: Preprotein translocase, SecG subunit [Candidatus Magasanikbacteria bacterium GW2011_GWA2_42_32]OGH86171.1 MAG: preprotein translocase subunit SecG [Candidatus Magasanikbacteria bacterium RIFOXYB2_FULL_38_10]
MNQYLNIIQIITAVLLTAAILLQAKGTGLSGVFGGEGNIFRTKRGMEKILFYATVVLAILFFATALANVYFSK